MVSTAGIIIIGDEILSGRTKDTNINWIASELNKIGVRLTEARIIPDDQITIIDTIKLFTKKFTYVFSCGGIGPTHDDITTECVAKAFNQELVKSKEAMRSFWKEYKEEHHTSSQIQGVRLHRMLESPKTPNLALLQM